MNAAALIAVLSFAAYTSATAHTPLTDAEIEAWFNLVDTNNDEKVTAAELDTAHAVFEAKCSLTDKITADGFFNQGDVNPKDECLSAQELDDDFHNFGELVDGETQSYYEILNQNNDDCIDRDEMRAGVEIMKDQCQTLTGISAKNCDIDGEAGFDEFDTCLHRIEEEVMRRRR